MICQTLMLKIILSDDDIPDYKLKSNNYSQMMMKNHSICFWNQL